MIGIFVCDWNLILNLFCIVDLPLILMLLMNLKGSDLAQIHSVPTLDTMSLVEAPPPHHGILQILIHLWYLEIFR